ncbi:unnamed protein product [Choristocarpus tenellus]
MPLPNYTSLWIVKPHDSSRGRKIFLMKDLSELAYDQQSIIQRYIEPPLTLGGYKADLRLYVLVTSLHPMTVHLYRNGLVRFATAKYKESHHGDLFGHLTNSSINKGSPGAAFNKDVIGGGCKWTLERLKLWIENSADDGVERWQRLWQRISTLVNLSILPLAPTIPAAMARIFGLGVARAAFSSCFEMFGFDVMLDAQLRPHLIEVNCSPALGLDGPTDR